MTIAVRKLAPTAADPLDESGTHADLVGRLGGISRERVMLEPPPGTATEEDLIRFETCELIDGTIVRKAVGFRESVYAVYIASRMRGQAAANGLGFVSGTDSLTRVAPGQVREPDASFFLWDRFPAREIPDVAIIGVAPELAVEVISPGNTAAEMERKRRELFGAGTRLMWIMNPRRRTVEVWTDAETCRTLSEDEPFDGGDLLPGFSLTVREWIEDAKRGR